MMTPEQERKWRELEAAASPAPWVVHPSLVLNEADAAFLSAARDAVPGLFAEVDALRAQDRVSAIENAVDAYARHGADIAAERDALRAERDALRAERDALQAKMDAAPVAAIRAMYAGLEPTDWQPEYADVADWLNTLA